MILHLVSFKYKAEATPAQRANHCAQLKSIASIDGILDFKVGEDIVRSPRSYDTGLLVVFRDRAALDSYATNPRHVPIANLGRDLSDSIVAVDFES